MTIEEKAKAYDKAIEKIKYVLGHGVSPVLNKEDLQDIFPELAESEDERIRGAIIDHLKDNNLTEWAAWLEKQGEPMEINPTEFDTRLQTLIGKFDNLPKEELIGSLSFWLNVVQNDGTYKDEEKQGKQKVSYTTIVKTGDGGINALVTRCIEIPFGAKDSELQEATYFIPKGYYAKVEGDKAVIKKGEQTPVNKVVQKFKVGDSIKTTNEEPLTITKIDDKGYWSEDLLICGFDDAAKWELVEQKPAWSEEDEQHIDSLLKRLDGLCRNEFERTRFAINEDGDWLKSLKQRIGG